jgi:hypothetical protein
MTEVAMSAPGRRCPECASPIVIHQPDTDLPDRLLGTCPRCGTWCLLDGGLRLVAILPTHGQRPPQKPKRWRRRGPDRDPSRGYRVVDD